jgi:hypothetical protein
LRRSIDVVEVLTEANGTLTLSEPKTEALRGRVSFPPFLADVLAEHVRRFPDRDAGRGLVFTGRDGGILRRSSFRRHVWLRRCKPRACLARRTFTTCATRTRRG